MNLKFISLALVSTPLLPIMYYQAKKIRKRVPKLPEAAGTEGFFKAKTHSDKTLNLITLGESTVAGVGVKTHQEGFTGTIDKELSVLMDVNVSWKTYAHNGYTAKLVEQRLIPKIKEKQIDIIVIGLGANDSFSLNPVWKWNSHIRLLIEKLHNKAPNALLFFSQMPPIKEFPAFTPIIKLTIGNWVEILGEELKKIEKDYPYVTYFSDIITLQEWTNKFQLKGKREDFFSDGVHPSKIAYQSWGKDVAQKIHHSLKNNI